MFYGRVMMFANGPPVEKRRNGYSSFMSGLFLCAGGEAVFGIRSGSFLLHVEVALDILGTLGCTPGHRAVRKEC